MIPKTELVPLQLDALLLRVASGDAAAFRTVYDRQSARLYGLALRLLKQPALASDAVHDTFVQVWQRAARFDPERGSAEAWLGGLLRFRAIDILRSRSREHTGLDLPEEADTDPDPLDRLITSKEGQALRQCLDALDERERRIVLLAFFDGQSHSQLASTLSAPLGTIKSWVRRALLTLRVCLDS